MSNANTNANANRSSIAIQESFIVDDRDLNLSKKMSK